MTANDAAVALGVSPATIRRQILNGRLRARKAGRDWQVSEEEVQRYRAESKGRPGRKTRMTLGLIDD